MTCVNYYLLVFLEAYADDGRWGYYMYPGVDEKTRLDATVPRLVNDYTRFIVDHREYYEECTTDNTIAILCADSAVLADSKGHQRYIALAQALAESGFQYDVLCAGDGNFIPGHISPEASTTPLHPSVMSRSACHGQPTTDPLPSVG